MVVPVSDTELRTTVSWTNPTTTLDGTPLSSIEEVVVLRDNEIISTLTDVVPGATIEIEDASVPRYDVYHYAVYVMADGRHGRHADLLNVAVGPSCTWKVVMSSSDFDGWKGGRLTVYNTAGHEVGHCSLESSTPSLYHPSLPLGRLSFGWTPPADTVEAMGITIRDAEGYAVYSFSGSSYELPSGIFFETNNSCGVDMVCDALDNLVATADGDNILLTWDAVDPEGYGVNLYRDGLLFRLVPTGTAFLDETASIGGHCYHAAVLCEGGEGEISNMSCATVGPCYPPRDLDYELTSNFKIKLNWESPVITDGLTGYFLFRKDGDGEYRRIKTLNASTTSYIDNSTMEEGDYYYQLYAYYRHLDCYSSPANRKYEPNVFELHAYYSPTGLEETETEWVITPNPTDGTVSIMGADLHKIEVYNVVGQMVMEKQEEGEPMVLDMTSLPSGMYFVNIIHRSGGGCVRKLLKQ